MAVGDNIDYKNRPGLAGVVARKLQSGTVPDGANQTGGWKRPNFCVKVSDTAPEDDTAADFPNKLYDMCVHYNAAGAYQGIYMATDGNLTSTCTWTQIA